MVVDSHVVLRVFLSNCRLPSNGKYGSEGLTCYESDFAEKSSLIIIGNSNLFAKNGGGVLQGQNSLATQLVVEFAAC